MERSEEIRRVVHRWMAAISVPDAEAALARLSDFPGALTIGTDVAEWWHGPDGRAIWQRQIEELGRFPVSWEAIDAWEEGSVGWASVKFTIKWADETHDMRGTYVLHLEHGEWKLVQIHWSIPRANEDIGMTLTRTIDELEAIIQRDRPDLSQSLAADGTVTIVFTDIVDSTPTLAAIGDRSWVDVLRRHNAVITQATETHGGTVVETQGDGSMLAFSSARRAVACARAIQHGITVAFADASPPIRVRIGMHTGDAIHEADQYFGTTVHYAARVASQALGGEVLVSSLVRELVAGPDVAFSGSRDATLKGLEGSHRLFILDLG